MTAWTSNAAGSDVDRQRQRGDRANARDRGQTLTSPPLALWAAVSLTSICLILVSSSTICRPNNAAMSWASGGRAVSCSIAVKVMDQPGEVPGRRSRQIQRRGFVVCSRAGVR